MKKGDLIYIETIWDKHTFGQLLKVLNGGVTALILIDFLSYSSIPGSLPYEKEIYGFYNSNDHRTIFQVKDISLGEVINKEWQKFQVILECVLEPEPTTPPYPTWSIERWRVFRILEECFDFDAVLSSELIANWLGQDESARFDWLDLMQFLYSIRKEIKNEWKCYDLCDNKLVTEEEWFNYGL